MFKQFDKVNKQRYEIELLKIFFWCQQLFIYRRRNYQTNKTSCNHSIWNLVRLFLSNLLYRKKEITVNKKSIDHKIELIITISAKVDVNAN